MTEELRKQACAAYRKQRKNSRTRGIGWKLTFEEWWSVWLKSGRWSQRGQTGYVMSRPGDSGNYEIGNVRIISASENHQEFMNTYWEEVYNGKRVRPPYEAKSHCKRGHEYTPENTYINPSDGHRHCRACLRKQWNRADAKRRGTKRKNGAK